MWSSRNCVQILARHLKVWDKPTSPVTAGERLAFAGLLPWESASSANAKASFDTDTVQQRCSSARVKATTNGGLLLLYLDL